jgi:molybdopterin/thiamine biosynthesis adenylyltransferase
LEEGAGRTWQDSSDTPDSGASETENQKPKTENPIAIVGAGALGNFVGLGLASLGFPLTLIDPDPVEVTNLNRQILFWDAVGQPKAEALARRLTEWFGVAARAEVAYADRNFDLSPFAVVFDCTDNHESRIVLSETCRENGQILISGGTGVEAGQVVIYHPARGGATPAELLGLYDIVGQREVDARERQRASCVYAPEPAIIMTNQIIGGLMVDAFRRALGGETPANLFYDARGEKMLS